MTSSPNTLRSQMIEATKVIWSCGTIIPAMVFSLAALVVLQPYLPVSPDPVRTAPPAVAVMFWICVFLAIFFVLRKTLWRPLRQLYDDIGDWPVFMDHCLRGLRAGLVFAPLLAVPLALLAVAHTMVLTAIAFGGVFLCDAMIKQRRQQQIVDSVDAILASRAR